MEFICFKCGHVNGENNITCDNCASTLIKGWQYDDKCKEIKDYEQYKKNAFTIIMSAVVTIVLYFGAKWFFKSISTVITSFNMTEQIIKYASIGVVVLFVVFAIIPIIVNTFKTRRKYGWTSIKMKTLELELQLLNKDSGEEKQSNS